MIEYKLILIIRSNDIYLCGKIFENIQIILLLSIGKNIDITKCRTRVIKD